MKRIVLLVAFFAGCQCSFRVTSQPSRDTTVDTTRLVEAVKASLAEDARWNSNNPQGEP